MTKPYVFSVSVSQIADPSPDTSYLEQDEFTERLEAYRRGAFGFIGIRAEAEVGYRLPCGDTRLERFTSGGLWGIEDDSGREYLAEVVSDELDDLKAHLEAFGIDTGDWAALTADYPCRTVAIPA